MSDYLKKTTILLVSSQTSFRSGLRKLLCDLGADNRHIEVASDYTQAMERLKKHDPVNIVVTDDEIGNDKSGLDLISLHEGNNPVSRTRIFIMLSGDINPFLESDFAVKGGDLLLKKPYTNAVFTEAIQKLIKERDSRSKEETTAMDVLDALRLKDMAMAVESFKAFTDESSYSALYCRGRIYEVDQSYRRAFEAYAEAMEKKVELRSLVSAIEVGALSKNYIDMLPMVETWIKNFPLHQESVPNITRAIVYNRKFSLLREMSKSLQEIKIGSVASIPMAAGYVVAAMDCFKTHPERAVFYALKGIEYSTGKPSILINAFKVLMSAQGAAEAEKIYKEMFSQPPFSEDKELEKEIRGILYPNESKRTS